MPGIIGWYTFVPFMQCKHGVVSMHHRLAGELLLNQTTVDLSGGRGYIEKDYGKSFPSAYIWMQSNHFEEDGLAFMLSIATIPWLRREFTGFLCALFYHSRLFRFATYTGARIRSYACNERKIRLIIEDRKHVLKVHGQSDSPVALKSPRQGEMSGHILESLTAIIRLQLFEKTGSLQHLVFEDTGRYAGMEIMDPKHQLANGLKL
jgi:hypothetical protein